MEPYGCVVVEFEVDVEVDVDDVFFVASCLFLVGGGGFVAADVFGFVAAGLAADLGGDFKGGSSWDNVYCPPSLILLTELL